MNRRRKRELNLRRQSGRRPPSAKYDQCGRWPPGLSASNGNIRIDLPLATQPFDVSERECRSWLLRSTTSGSFHSQPEQRKHLGEVDEPLGFFALRRSQPFAAVLAVQEFLESGVNPWRQSKPRQIIRDLQLNRDHLWHVISSIVLTF